MRAQPRVSRFLQYSRRYIHPFESRKGHVRSMASANGDRNSFPSAIGQNQDYTQWSNDDLIKRVTDLEARLRAQNAQHSKPPSSETSPAPPKKKPKKSAKPFDPSKYSSRLIALKFAYLGGRYNGFEHHTNNTTPIPTVEEELWKALRKTKLIFPEFKEGQSEDEVCWDGCEYSKCGRTDRGVSAFGQVVGLRVRSSWPKEKTIANGLQTNVDSSGASVDSGGECPMPGLVTSHEDAQPKLEPTWHLVKDELPYIQLLNRVLPPDIRVLAWCPNPPPNFSARFNCKERRYRYFFTNPAYVPNPQSSSTDTRDAWLNIRAMQHAAKKLEGLHDFRNFCKVDPSKQICNFERRVFQANIELVDSDLQPGAFLTRPPFTSSERLQMYYFEVHGSAFLWHQVRHMVAILFLVGQGYEAPGIVDRLLDVESCRAKPMYDMADETPLVLWDCIFPDLDQIGVSDHGNFGEGNGSEDTLDWIYVGDHESEDVGRRGRSVTDAMRDRKYGRLGIMEDLWAQWRRTKMDEVLAGSLMDVVARQGKISASTPELKTLRAADTSARVFDGSGTPRNVGRYIPIMQRDRMETPEVLNARYSLRKGLNGTRSVNGDADVDE